MIIKGNKPPENINAPVISIRLMCRIRCNSTWMYFLSPKLFIFVACNYSVFLCLIIMLCYINFQRRNKGSRNCTATTKENIDDSNRNSCTSIPVAAVYSKINALISDENADDSEYRCYLFELPESVLFVLLSYLDVSSIYRLSQ